MWPDEVLPLHVYEECEEVVVSEDLEEGIEREVGWEEHQGRATQPPVTSKAAQRHHHSLLLLEKQQHKLQTLSTRVVIWWRN